MARYMIGFYDLANNDAFTFVESKVCKCDANALRIVATKLQHKTIVAISYYTQRDMRYIMVRYR